MDQKLYSLSKGDPSNPHVLCLHGLLGSARTLLRLVDAIATAGFYVVAYDQLGHGHSPHATSPDEYSIPNLARDVFRVMDAHQIKRAHLVGHSMGARVSLAATAIAPGRIRSLAMLDAGIRTNEIATQELRALIEPLPDGYASRAEAEQALGAHSPGLRQFLLSNLRVRANDAEQRLRWMFDLDGIRARLLPAISLDQALVWRQVACPALVARGELSGSLTTNDFDEMLRLNSRAKGAVIPGAAHWVHVDNFSATASTVISFLKSVGSNK